MSNQRTDSKRMVQQKQYQCEHILQQTEGGRSANLANYLGLGGDGLVEFAPDDDSGDILPPDYSDQTLANSDIINYLEKIYEVELDSLSAERDIQNALLMINSTLNGLDNNSDNSEILGALNAIKALLENNLGGGSDS